MTISEIRLVFRADASDLIGSGHAMRCAALIDTAVKFDIPCVFVGDLGNKKWLRETIQKSGALYLRSIADLNSQLTRDVLVIDSYELSVHNEVNLRDWKLIVKITDSLPFPLDCDLVVNPHLGKNYIGGTNPRVISGKDFIPLRTSIRKKINANVKNQISNLVVFGGGTDVFHFCYQLAKVLANIYFFDKAIFFSNEKRRIENLDTRFEVIQIGNRLDDFVDSADLVLTTSSTSSLEIIARELPLGVLSVVRNQDSNFKEISEAGIGVALGYRTETGNWQINSPLLKQLITDKNLRMQITTNQKNYISLNGSENILTHIFQLII